MRRNEKGERESGMGSKQLMGKKIRLTDERLTTTALGPI